MTRVGESHVADGIYRSVRSQFSEKELVDLTLAIIAINGWNRLVVIFPAVPGSYTRDVISTPAKVV